MSKKRKDRKGRILKVGESQRKDLIYQYRYIDGYGIRRSVYSSDLAELRAKEKEIQKHIDEGIDYTNGTLKVYQLVEKYLGLKAGLRRKTQSAYNNSLKIIKNDPFGYRMISEVKPSDAKEWFVKLSNDGRAYNSISSIRTILLPAFEMAYQENILHRNPFSFKLSSVLRKNSTSRKALTLEQQQDFLEFMRTDPVYNKYFNEIVLLLNIGVRISELYGLTKADLDFENREFHINKQLLLTENGVRYVEKPKTETGFRTLPMTDTIYNCFQTALRTRIVKKGEPRVDGYEGFVFLCKTGAPKVAQNLEASLERAMKKYCKVRKGSIPPTVTPHVLRHSFCTNMATAGLNIKSLQYVMGHSDANMTLNVYAHSDRKQAAEQMLKIAASAVLPVT